MRVGPGRGRPTGARGRGRPGAERHRRVRRPGGHAGDAGGGGPLALANKESLVCAGSLVTGTGGAGGRADPAGGLGALGAVPTGRSRGREAVRVGGHHRFGGTVPRPRRRATWRRSRREQALAHPTWTMGAKITIDSATLMNKGLEVIEAHHLFGVPYERIEVVVHPQSLVHALGAAGRRGAAGPPGHARHAGAHRLRAALPGAGAGGRRPLGSGGRACRLEFAAPRRARPSLPAAGPRGGRAGDAATCALNAANEVAVRASWMEAAVPGYSRGGGGWSSSDSGRRVPSERTRRWRPSMQ